MSHRCLTFLRTGAFGVAALLATAAGRAADPSPYPVVALESGGELRAEVHPATAEDGETVILEAPGLLIELPRAAVDEATPPDALLVEYAERAAKAADTAPDQFTLAEWCEEQDLDP